MSALRVLLVGEDSAGLRVLRLLESLSHTIVAVASDASKTGIGETLRMHAQTSGIQVLSTTDVATPSFADWLRDYDVDLLLNVHSLAILPGEVVAATRIGSFNVHPGPLPTYSGLNCPSWAIYNGEAEHGVTVHWMDSGVDSGAIAFETRFPISLVDSGLTLSARCTQDGVQLVSELLAVAATSPSRIPKRPQQGERQMYGGRPPQNGLLDWEEAGHRVVGFVRAADFMPFASPWGHPITSVGGREMGIARAVLTDRQATGSPGDVGAVEDDGVLVATADKWVLVRHVQVRGSYVDARDVVRPGTRFEPPVARQRA